MSDYTELKRLAESAAGKSYISGEKFFFSAEATPERVLALIAENDLQRKDLQNLRTDNAQLIYALKQEEQSYLVLRAERDQLCAEVAGLRTGYEAYERVNAELKAENEALRNALMECTDSLQGEMLQKFGGQLPEDMHPVTRREYDRDIAEVSGYRAALGQGDQP